ncbi:MAG TPA: M56 family metallopeptidase [Mucilaginibacter sp.]|nr:M56 family metallopeptidase [Mucilaginibacter sp.]
MNWLHYLLEANIYLAVFYLLYLALFTKDTHYKLARVYLLATCILAYIIPLVQISWLIPEAQRQTVTIIDNGGLLSGQVTPAAHTLGVDDIIFYAYCAGVIVMVSVFILKLLQILRLARIKGDKLHDKYKLVRLKGSNTAFSFFNYVFIGTNVNGVETIVRHELAHITQKHSFDVVFLELIKAISWFNPFIHLLERSMKTIHEYIADEQAAAYDNDAVAYSSFLVDNAYGIGGSSLTHSFFNYNLLKKRIIMLNQKRSGKLARLKYLMTLPVCGALLCVSTLGFSKNYGWIDIGHSKNSLQNDDNQQSHEKNLLKKGEYSYAIDPANYNSKKLDDAIRWFKDRGYVMNYEEHDGAQPLLTVSLKTTAVFKWKSSVSATFDVDALKKDKLFIFVAADEVNSKLYVKSMPENEYLKTDTGKKIPPPPPPAPPKQVKLAKAPKVLADTKTEKMPPPPPPKPVKLALKMSTDTMGKLPPPPPPADPFESFYKYVSRNVRYPAKDRENLVAGRVIVGFNTVNNKISDVKIIRGVESEIDNEVLRVLNSYSQTLPGNMTITHYALSISFVIMDAKGNPLGNSPKTEENEGGNKNSSVYDSNNRYMLNEIVVASYAPTK